MSEFRFSPNPNTAHVIDWLPWGAPAFAKAQETDRPVLLSISAVWCYWCHVMDDTSYSDPDVQSLISDNFIAVRVDNDHRPDIDSRYNVGGWPTTAFLTPHGGLIGGATYLPPDQFVAMLAELKEAYRADKPQLYSQSLDLLNRRKEQARRPVAGPDVSEVLVDRVARIVAGSYDAANGGFGSEPKFANPGILRFVNHLYRTTGEDFYAAMLRKSLDHISEGQVLDAQDGGFFRHCAKADWSEPQQEKMLEDNLLLARCFLDSSILLDDPRYQDVALRTVQYLMEHLYDPSAPGFRGSQGAHSEYFAMPGEQRRSMAEPPADPSCYANTGAMAATVFLDAAWKLGRRDLADTGLLVLDHLDGLAQSGRLSHVYSAEGPSEAPALLSDWAWLLTALVQAHASTARGVYLDRAVAVAALMVERFFDDANGGFFDIEAGPEAVGHLQVREKSLAENVVSAQALLRLYQTTRNEDYRQVSEAALSAFVETYREQGEFASEYGLAVHLLKNPMVEVTVEGDPADPGCQGLLRSALRLAHPNLDVKTVLLEDGDGLARAHVCFDTLCLPPVSTPEALEAAVSGLPSQQDSPFENILQIFPGN